MRKINFHDFFIEKYTEMNLQFFVLESGYQNARKWFKHRKKMKKILKRVVEINKDLQKRVVDGMVVWESPHSKDAHYVHEMVDLYDEFEQLFKKEQERFIKKVKVTPVELAKIKTPASLLAHRSISKRFGRWLGKKRRGL
ncbi:MAG: hypothetical protein GXP63_02445 [DPANN group archaeon]|nr:hypothetical protein [DPANN group archaeon]